MAETPPSETPTDPGDLRATLVKMSEHAEAMRAHAESMRSSADIMAGQVDACLKAVKGVKSDLEDVKLTADQAAADVLKVKLAPMRPKLDTLSELEGAPDRRVQEPATAQNPHAVSASIHATEKSVVATEKSLAVVASIVPAARKENRALSIVIAFLLVLSQAIQIARGH